MSLVHGVTRCVLHHVTRRDCGQFVVVVVVLRRHESMVVVHADVLRQIVLAPHRGGLCFLEHVSPRNPLQSLCLD